MTSLLQLFYTAIAFILYNLLIIILASHNISHKISKSHKISLEPFKL